MIDPFRKLTTRTIALPESDIDTDQIIPARFLTTTEKAGLGDKCFYDWRFADDGAPTSHDLNRANTKTHQILVAGDNFGCGSSREHAPWAMTAFGFRAVISSSFGDIFRSNALKSGLLPIEVTPDIHDLLLTDPGREIAIDLEAEELRTGNYVVSFRIEPFARTCLLEGTDPMGVLLAALPEIETFEERTGVRP